MASVPPLDAFRGRAYLTVRGRPRPDRARPPIPIRGGTSRGHHAPRQLLRRRSLPRTAPPPGRDGPPRRPLRACGRARRRRLPGGEPLRRPRRDRGRRRAARSGGGRPRGPRPPGHAHHRRHPPPRRGAGRGLPPAGAPERRLQPHRPAPVPGRSGPGRGAARGRGAAAEPAAAGGGQAAPDRHHRLTRTARPPPTRRTEVDMPEAPTTTSPSGGAEAERVRAAQPQGTERTRERPVYVPRVDIVETEDALEILADMPGVARDGVEVTLEQRVLSLRGRAEVSVAEGLAPLYLEYEPGEYERSFTLSDAVDPGGIEARVRAGVLHLRLPKAGPAKARFSERVEAVRDDEDAGGSQKGQDHAAQP